MELIKLCQLQYRTFFSSVSNEQSVKVDVELLSNLAGNNMIRCHYGTKVA